jgi:hypothetical protein
MCMKPICSIDAVLSGVSDVIQALTASHAGECGVVGRTQVNSQNGLAAHSFFRILKFVGYGHE